MDLTRLSRSFQVISTPSSSALICQPVADPVNSVLECVVEILDVGFYGWTTIDLGRRTWRLELSSSSALSKDDAPEMYQFPYTEST